MKNRGLIKHLVIAAALAAGAVTAPASFADTLRVCADPDNLPFSKSEGNEHGLYVDLADLVAKKLGAKVEYVWWLSFNQRRALRNTIQDDNCDAYFALPAGGDYKARGLVKTDAFLSLGYAVVSNNNFVLENLSDLKGKKVAVQFGSTPQIVLSTKEGYAMSTYRQAEEAMDALAKGEVDVAFLWGPIAGFENKKRFQSRYKITPVTGFDLSGQVAVAVPREKEQLIAKINKALFELKPEINGLAEKYGFPQIKPVDVAAPGKTSGLPAVVFRGGFTQVQWNPHAAQPQPMVLANADTAQTKKPSKSKAKPAEAAAPVAAAAPVLSDAAKAGRIRFNDQCSHCHSVDGASPLPERNLRRVQARYDAKWKDMAVTTIKNGRADLGMPPWKDVYGEKEITELISFIETIQK